ncbi:unnamed protein product [Boreogadus saida]
MDSPQGDERRFALRGLAGRAAVCLSVCFQGSTGAFRRLLRETRSEASAPAMSQGKERKRPRPNVIQSQWVLGASHLLQLGLSPKMNGKARCEQSLLVSIEREKERMSRYMAMTPGR